VALECLRVRLTLLTTIFIVAVRVRPPLQSTDPGFELVPQRFQRSMVHNISPTSLAIDSPQGRRLFLFDRVFGEDVQQEGVFEYIQESVNAFIQGYNVSVLAYGQSGSGKSYTMGTSGPAEQSNPRIMGTYQNLSAARNQGVQKIRCEGRSIFANAGLQA
jgi:kinesin family protein 4/21/27